jgi:integrase
MRSSSLQVDGRSCGCGRWRGSKPGARTTGTASRRRAILAACGGSRCGSRPPTALPSHGVEVSRTGAFLHAAAGDRLYPLFHLIAFRGLRRGEACALKWPDIDLDSGLLTVSGNRVQFGWEVEESDPKSDSSDASVSLDSGTVTVLRAWRKLQQRSAWHGGWPGPTSGTCSLTRTAPR